MYWCININLRIVIHRSQRVGASKYYVRPRYVRPVEKPLSELQRLMLKAGAVATASIISSRFSSEGKLDRGKPTSFLASFPQQTLYLPQENGNMRH